MPPSSTATKVPRAPASRPAERRATVRYQSAAKGSCQTLSSRRESAWDAALRDISTSGIGMRLGRRFEPGALLSVEMPDPSDGQTRMLLARVIHATALPEGGWLIGCALVHALTDEEVASLR